MSIVSILFLALTARAPCARLAVLDRSAMPSGEGRGEFTVLC